MALTLLPAFAARFTGGERPDPGLPDDEEFDRERGRVGRMLGRIGGSLVRAVFATGALVRDLLGFWFDGLRRGLRPVTSRAFDVFDRWFDRFAAWYDRTLQRALDRRGIVLASATAALAASLLLAATLERDLLPNVDQGAFDVRLELEEGTSLSSTLDAASEIEQALLADEDVDAVFSRIGRDVRSFAESEEGSGLNTASFQVRLVPSASTVEVVERLRALADQFPTGALSFVTGRATALGQLLGGSDADIAVRIRTEDLERAYERALEVQERLVGLPSVANVRIAQEQGVPQVQVEILREQAARYGIDPRTVAETLERSNRGDFATEFVEFDRKIDVVVRFPADIRYSLASLDQIRVNGIPIRELIRVREAIAPSEVSREDQGRVMVVHADVVAGGLAGAIADVNQALDALPREAGLRMDVGGENEEMRRSFRDLAFAFGLALLLVYMILAAQFESLFQPFTILAAVPLALVGAVAALALAGQGLNTMSLIGVVILIGIVVNDAIVKVEFINQARGRGASLRDAILEAGHVRLRPIVMTTVTTVLGLLPMALGLGRGADLRAPLAIAVIGGLIVATLLTLVVVPVIYSFIEGRRGGWNDATSVHEALAAEGAP